MHFCEEYDRRCLWRHILSVCPISRGDVNFDHLVKVVFVRLLYCEVTLSPFVIYRYLVGEIV